MITSISDTIQYYVDTFSTYHYNFFNLIDILTKSHSIVENYVFSLEVPPILYSVMACGFCLALFKKVLHWG